ncbi:hypothetical protein [Verrucomicrobium sp. 3C]|uniref:hypothetical protein n=1 Tax=Verrucomicrobium sp. 3C TaxID=1134055 RepID=UPI0003756749|nr:hypothetical protein [Verrucomicrobium sp. 3C]
MIENVLMMTKKTIDLILLVALTVFAASLLGDWWISGRLSERRPIFHSSLIPPRETDNGNGLVEGRWQNGKHYWIQASNGLIWSCPNERYAKELGEIALQQLSGRYWIGPNRHLYLKVANHEPRALRLRSLPASAGSWESGSWLAEVANYNGPEVWSCSRDISPAERRDGVEFRGGFLLLQRVTDPVTFEPKTAVRLFSPQERSWGNWQPGTVVVCADASRKNGQWHIQWRMEAVGGRFMLANDPGVNPEFETLFRDPFFLLPIAASDIP